MTGVRGSSGGGDSPRAMLALGGCFILLVGILALGTGACLLVQHRGRAGRDLARAETTPPGMTEIESIREELLVTSGELSDPHRGEYDLVRAGNRLESLDLRLEQERDDPAYLKVRALHESVELQLKMLDDGEDEGTERIPPLPPSSISPEPDEKYVGAAIDESDLLKGRIYTPSKSLSIRYGPGLFHVARRPRKRSTIGSLDAPKGWKFVEVEIGISGRAELVEYRVGILDDYRRLYPAYLGGEKQLRKEELEGSDGEHAIWRDVHATTSRKHVLWLHRVFLVPADSCKNLVLEIQRQGASKKIWVQY